MGGKMSKEKNDPGIRPRLPLRKTGMRRVHTLINPIPSREALKIKKEIDERYLAGEAERLNNVSDEENGDTQETPKKKLTLNPKSRPTLENTRYAFRMGFVPTEHDCIGGR
jgi:hypothetical protein